MLFISHATEDKEAALDVYRVLEEKGYQSNQIFLDSHRRSGIYASEEYRDVIYSALAQAVAIIVLWSESWNQSKWCFLELTQAEMAGKPIFPVVLGASKPPEGLLEKRQAIFPNRDEDAYPRLVESLGKQGLGPGELTGFEIRTATTDQYRQFISELVVEKSPAHQARSIPNLQEGAGGLALEILRWAAAGALPPIDLLDGELGGHETAAAKAHAEDFRRTHEDAVRGLQSKLSNCNDKIRYLERKRAEIKREKAPQEPEKTTETSSLLPAGEALAQRMDHLAERRRERLDAYKEKYAEYESRKLELTDLRHELLALEQQVIMVEGQKASLELAFKGREDEIAKSIRDARGRDFALALERLRDSARLAVGEKKTVTSGYFTLLAMHIVTPMLRPVLASSSQRADALIKDLVQWIEGVSKQSYSVVSFDILASWQHILQAMSDNEAHILEMRGILEELPLIDLTRISAKMEELVAVELPKVPDYSRVFDPEVLSLEAEALAQREVKAYRFEEKCQTVLDEADGFRIRVNSVLEEAGKCESRVMALADTSAQILAQARLALAVKTISLTSGLPRHSNAFLRSLLEAIELKVAQDPGEFARYCERTRFRFVQAQKLKNAHPSTRFFDSRLSLLDRLMITKEYLGAFQSARQALALRPQEIFEERLLWMQRLVALSFVPGLQLLCAILVFGDQRIEPAIRSEHPKLVPLRGRMKKLALVAMMAACFWILVPLWILLHMGFMGNFFVEDGALIFGVVLVIGAFALISSFGFGLVLMRFHRWSSGHSEVQRENGAHSR